MAPSGGALKIGISLNQLGRSESRRRAVRPVRRRACRVIFPRDFSRLQATLRNAYSNRRNPSLTNIAQWYLDRRFPSEGPKGLLYQVPNIPLPHTAESVSAALTAAVAALRTEPPDPPGPAIPDGVHELSGESNPLCTPAPPPARQDTSAFVNVLLDLPAFPELDHGTSTHAVPAFRAHSSTLIPSLNPKDASPLIDSLFDLPPIPELDQYPSTMAGPVFRGHLIDLPDLPELPVMEPKSASVDDLILAPTPGTATLLAPLLPTVRERKIESGPGHLSLAPESRYPPFRKERQQSHPQIRKKGGTRDLKSRAATHPQPGLVPSQDTPISLQVSGPVAVSAMIREPLAQDALRTRVPSGVRTEDLPQSLQVGDRSSSRSLGLNGEMKTLPDRDSVRTEDLPGPLRAGDTRSGVSQDLEVTMDRLINAVDVARDSFQLPPDLLDPNLGSFCFEFPCVVSAEPSRARRQGGTTSKMAHQEPTHSSKSGSPLLGQASTSKAVAPSPTLSPHSSLKEDGRSQQVIPGRIASKMDGKRHAHSTRPLPPLALAPEAMQPARPGTVTRQAVSNATIKAILAAEDESINNGTDRRPPRSQHSAALVQEFSEFTHRAFFNRTVQTASGVRSQSDGTLWPSAPARTPRVDAPLPKHRPASVDSLAIRKEKGKGIVFATE